MLSFVEVSCDVAAALFHIIAAVCLEVAENVFYIAPPHPPRGQWREMLGLGL